MAQLVRIPRDENGGDRAGDGGGGDDDDDTAADGDGTILSVSQVEDANGRTLEATGRSVASVQFMITRAMRAQLKSLGYTPEEVDRMDPPRAAAILAQRVPSSKQAQTRSRDLLLPYWEQCPLRFPHNALFPGPCVKLGSGVASQFSPLPSFGQAGAEQAHAKARLTLNLILTLTLTLTLTLALNLALTLTLNRRRASPSESESGSSCNSRGPAC